MQGTDTPPHHQVEKGIKEEEEGEERRKNIQKPVANVYIYIRLIIAGPVISVLTARFGCRPIAIFGGFLFGLGYIGQAILNEHLYWFIIFCAISGKIKLIAELL